MMPLPLSAETLMLLAVLTPAVGAFLIALCHRQPDLREAFTLATAGALALIVWSLMPPVLAGARPEKTLLDVLPGLTLAFNIEPLGLLFALVASTLWVVNSVYSIGYMRANNEPRQTTFYVCFAVALAATMGLAFSANLLTLFLFYELLTLSTYPLVTHKATPEAVRAGRIYISILVGSSMLLLLPAIIWTWMLAGTMTFRSGGIVPAGTSTLTISLLLGLYAFGIGKVALIPLHGWLPAAMVAPTPVSALLHAVAVVKAGAFCVVKVIVYVFGVETLARTGASDWLIVAASFTLLTASAIALTKDNLKARLAYSTVSQLSYVVLGAALAVSAGIIGAALQIVMHAAGKITLFFCAGAIYTAAHKTEISELRGLGHKMPWTFAAFLIGTLSIIGLPPLGGTWSKWWLVLGALDAGQLAVVAVLLVSTLLNVLYLLPIAIGAFFLPERKLASVGAAGVHHVDALPADVERGHWLVVLPPCLTALACIVLFVFADRIVAFLQPIAAP